MNSRDIETFSVNAVKDSITASDRLEEFISDNDKEPFWDGSIKIYREKKGIKRNSIGEVRVQVKGKEDEDHTKDEISYNMDIIDLKYYLNNGGCFLFVVYINPDNFTKKIYYSDLTQSKLEKILKNNKNKYTKAVKLKPFPFENGEKYDLLLKFYYESNKKDISYLNTSLDFNKLDKMDNIENLVFSSPSSSSIDFNKVLKENRIQFYAKLKDVPVPIPIKNIPKIDTISNSVNCIVSVDGKTYYDKITIVRKINRYILYIGESLKLIYKENSDYYKIEYESSNKARVLAKDLEFNLKVLETGSFKINDIEINVGKDELIYNNFNIDALKKNLLFAKDVVKTLDILGCDDDICFNELGDQDWLHLNILINAFAYNKTISGIENISRSVCYVCVGDLKFYIYIEEIKFKNEYKIYNFFDRYLPSTYCDKNNESESFDVSQFIILKKNDFLTVSNIDFKKIFLDFKDIKHNSETFSTANYYLLELLAAADIAEGKRKEKILKACEDFALWIKEAPDDELEDEIKTINLLQVYKRQRDLTDDEKDELYDIVENNSNNNQYMVGAYLLLGKQRRAERFFDKMSKEDKNEFKKYPIYHFWRNCKSY